MSLAVYPKARGERREVRGERREKFQSLVTGHWSLFLAIMGHTVAKEDGPWK
jgi:hypothetical protein